LTGRQAFPFRSTEPEQMTTPPLIYRREHRPRSRVSSQHTHTWYFPLQTTSTHTSLPSPYYPNCQMIACAPRGVPDRQPVRAALSDSTSPSPKGRSPCE
jgi:hypothetical protein